MEHNKLPFVVTTNDNGITAIDTADGRGTRHYIAVMGYDEQSKDDSARALANAQFICLACNNYHAMITALNELMAAVNHLPEITPEAVIANNKADAVVQQIKSQVINFATENLKKL